ncbi:MAG: hypothetical protein ACMG6E_07165 [Candidatus Roizmanbacteria bacterium]
MALVDTDEGFDILSKFLLGDFMEEQLSPHAHIPLRFENKRQMTPGISVVYVRILDDIQLPHEPKLLTNCKRWQIPVTPIDFGSMFLVQNLIRHGGLAGQDLFHFSKMNHATMTLFRKPLNEDGDTIVDRLLLQQKDLIRIHGVPSWAYYLHLCDGFKINETHSDSTNQVFTEGHSYYNTMRAVKLIFNSESDMPSYFDINNVYHSSDGDFINIESQYVSNNVSELFVSTNGSIKLTHSQMQRYFKHSYYGLKLSYNCMSYRPEVHLPGIKASKVATCHDLQTASLVILDQEGQIWLTSKMFDAPVLIKDLPPIKELLHPLTNTIIALDIYGKAWKVFINDTTIFSPVLYDRLPKIRQMTIIYERPYFLGVDNHIFDHDGYLLTNLLISKIHPKVRHDGFLFVTDMEGKLQMISRDGIAYDTNIRYVHDLAQKITRGNPNVYYFLQF